MPDVGVPPPSPQTHTSTQEWQSFEIRMRRRRAERCVLRAEVALDAGFEDDARAALDEARQLDWHSPDFESLKARIDQRRAAESAQRTGRRRIVYAAAVVLALVATGAALVFQDAPPDPPVAAAPAPATSAPSATVAPPASEPVPEPVATAPVDVPLLPDAQPPSVESLGQPQLERERPRPEPAVPARAETRAFTPPEPAARATAPVAPPLRPQVAVPTTSLPVQQAVPEATGLIGRSSIAAITPPPAAESRVPDLPAAPPAAPPPAPRVEPPAAPDDSGVRAALAQYESAYTSLNASAAHAVYPGIDERSLERAFGSLESQQVSLGRCSIAMNGARAQATCQGSATWTPKVGGGTQRSARTWRFELASTGTTWRITRADAR